MPRGYPTRRRDWVTRQGHYGEKSANALWSDKEARTIRECRASGFSYNDLMKMFGGTQGTLAALCYGRTYRTAGGPIAGVDYPRGRHGRSVF